MGARTLVLNSGYEPMQLVSWKKALCLVLIGKAEVVSEYHNVVRSVRMQVKQPSIVRLKTYVHIVRRIGMVRCTRKNILLRDKNQCQYCGKYCNSDKITIDHIVPRSRGGKTAWTNVVACCPPCNLKKGNRPLSQLGMVLMSQPRYPGWSDMLHTREHQMSPDWLPYLPFKN